MSCSPPGSSVHGILQARTWSGLPFHSPGDLSGSGIEPGCPTLQVDSLPSKPPGKTFWVLVQFSCSVLSDSLRPHGLQHPGFPVHQQLPELAQTHVHWVGDAIQLSHPLSSPSPPAFNFSQHQNLFQWVSSSHKVAKVLDFQLQHQSFQWIFRIDFL